MIAASSIEYLLDAILIAVVLFAVASPASPLQTMSDSEPLHVRAEMVVPTEWLARHLSDRDVVILCIAGNKSFYNAGHIPGARLIELGEIAVTRENIPNELPGADRLKSIFERAGVTKRSRIILYGERYGQLAARAYFTLDFLGLADRAALLDGGFEKWKTEGRPQSTAMPPVVPTRLSLAPNQSVVVDASGVKRSSSATTKNHPGRLALIDARPAEEYSGKRFSEDVPKAGHIPGAVNVYWMENLVSRENPVLRPVEELRRIYKQAGAAADTRVVTYCRTGMQSSFDYFIAKYLGYQVSMYDASFFEWSREDLPVERSDNR